MHIEADLDVSLDGTSFHVGGEGAVLRVATADVSSLMAALRDSGQLSRSRLAQVAEQVADQGLSVELSDHRGPILTLGAEAKPGPLRLLTGTRHVSPASFRSSLLLARIAVGRRAVTFSGALAVAGTLAIALTAVARSARTRCAPAHWVGS